MITHVLFDLDGTLIDSNQAHAESWAQALKEFGMEYRVEYIRPLIGMGSDHLLPELTGISKEDPIGKKIADRRGEIFREQYLKTLRPFPGARELIKKILDNGLRFAIASSSSEEDLKGLLQQTGIEDLVKHSTSADDADRSKPSPDIIMAALQKLKARPQDAVMIGDTPYDISAAAKAGVKTIAFACGGWEPEELTGAYAIYEGPWHLVDRFESSILRRRYFGSSPSLFS